MTPFFSIIIPTYNRAHLIQETLSSFQEQSFQDFEVIVIDDGGKDDTKDIVDALNDHRFNYYWKENAERGAARNYGSSLAKGQYLNFFDSDDIAFENHLSVAHEYFKLSENENNILHTSYCFGFQRKRYGDIIFEGKLNTKVFQSNCLSCNNVFILKRIFDKQKFSEIRELSASEDWELWIRLSLKYNIIGVADITSTIIQHDSRSMAIASGISTEIRAQSIVESLAYALKNRREILNNIIAEMYSLSALHYAMEAKRKDVYRCLKIAFRAKFSTIFSKRFLAIVKHSLFFISKSNEKDS
jgi:glycosyltransferase involved in cell wall biosynthesis